MANRGGAKAMALRAVNALREPHGRGPCGFILMRKRITFLNDRRSVIATIIGLFIVPCVEFSILGKRG
jgi:hypothetical protein